MNDNNIKDILSLIKEQIDIFTEAEKEIRNILKIKDKNKICDVRITIFSKIRAIYTNYYIIIFYTDPLTDLSHPFWSDKTQCPYNFDPKKQNENLDNFLKISLTLTIFSCIEHLITELYIYNKKENKPSITEKGKIKLRRKSVTEKLNQSKELFGIEKCLLTNYKSFGTFQLIRNAAHNNFISDENFNYESNEIEIKFEKDNFIQGLNIKSLFTLQQENISFLKDIIKRYGNFDQYIEDPIC